MRASLVVQLVKNLPVMQETPVQGHDSWAGKFPWRRDRIPTSVFLGFPGDSDGKESACNVGDLGSIPGSGRYPGEGKGYPFQYYGLGCKESERTEQLSLSQSLFLVHSMVI